MATRYEEFLKTSEKPDQPINRRGQWVPGRVNRGDWEWHWQDWGADYGFEFIMPNKRSGACEECGVFVDIEDGLACLKDKRWWLICSACEQDYEVQRPRPYKAPRLRFSAKEKMPVDVDDAREIT